MNIKMILKALSEFLRKTPKSRIRDRARNEIENIPDFGYYKKICDYNGDAIGEVIREPYSRIEKVIKIMQN